MIRQGEGYKQVSGLVRTSQYFDNMQWRLSLYSALLALSLALNIISLCLSSYLYQRWTVHHIISYVRMKLCLGLFSKMEFYKNINNPVFIA